MTDTTLNLSTNAQEEEEKPWVDLVEGILELTLGTTHELAELIKTNNI